MKKTLLSLVAVATISTGVGMSAQAEEVIVNKGDTLSSLSKQHGVSIEDIKEWNGLASDLIIEDQAITISPEEYHTVVSGDTLWSIAAKYGVSIAQLQEWNKISNHIIHPDQKIVVKGGNSAKANNNSQSQPKDQNPAVKEASANAVSEQSAKKQSVAKNLTVTATAYTASCEGCSGITAAGVNLKENPDAKVIAVDPSVIPLGTKVYVEGYGYATAADTGGAIKGNKIDVFIPTQSAAMAWGKRQVNVQILQ